MVYKKRSTNYMMTKRFHVTEVNFENTKNNSWFNHVFMTDINLTIISSN